MSSEPVDRERVAFAILRNGVFVVKAEAKLLGSRDEKDPSADETMLEVPRAYKICWVLTVLALLGVAQPASSQVRYRVVDLGVLEQATSSIVRGFNSANEVVGGTTGFGRGQRAFLVTKGKAENLGGLPGTDSSVAHAISDDSTAVGSSNTARSIHAFIWTRRDGVRDLGTLPGDSGSQAFGINRQKEVVGYSSGTGRN